MPSNLTLMAYASQVMLRLVGPVNDNCSVTYSMSEGTPVGLVSQSWVKNVISDHESFCQGLEQVVNPLTMYQGFAAPPQVMNAILSTVNNYCSGPPGNYTSVIHELRSIRLSASFRCHGMCNGTDVSILVIGVEPYGLNYYALWSGTYITWFNNSLMVIRNVGLNPFNLGVLINLFISATYYSALLLGFIGIVAMAPRIRHWARLMDVVKVKLGIGYEDLVTIASPVVSMVTRDSAKRESLVRRYATLRRVYELTRRRYARHALKTAYWAVRDLPRISTAPHVLLPTLYGVSLAREYLMRRVSMIERKYVREALRAVVGVTLSPSLVLRPYSLVNPLFRQGVNALARYLV
ncbi:hypothetical protein [Vulcanisaeta distributa]|uniref:hypothetical protein n=1 Tax=Vulcanisaeta distributa TaxID=164451 RepID=UPI0006D16A0C|nr:hypothetical protein [Vulcanisaeta distributa]